MSATAEDLLTRLERLKADATDQEIINAVLVGEDKIEGMGSKIISCLFDREKAKDSSLNTEELRKEHKAEMKEEQHEIQCLETRLANVKGGATRNYAEL